MINIPIFAPSFWWLQPFTEKYTCNAVRAPDPWANITINDSTGHCWANLFSLASFPNIWLSHYYAHVADAVGKGIFCIGKIVWTHQSTCLLHVWCSQFIFQRSSQLGESALHVLIHLFLFLTYMTYCHIQWLYDGMIWYHVPSMASHCTISMISCSGKPLMKPFSREVISSTWKARSYIQQLIQSDDRL